MSEMAFPRIPIKYIADVFSGGTPRSNPQNWDGDVPFITPPDLNGLDGAVVENWGRTVSEVGAKSGSTLIQNAVLISCRAPVGHIGTVRGEVSFNQGCKAIVPADDADLSFISKCLVADRKALQIASRGTTFTELSTTELYDHPIPWPKKSTRRRIADYLDHETSQIDAMIDKLGELEVSLRSRHRSDVTKAVTGDDSGITRKTGNTWIPEIPSHWNLGTVRLVSQRVTDGSHVSPETENGVYDFVSTRDITNGVIDFEGSLKTSESSYEELVRGGCQPFDGDLLYSKDGTIGETAIVHGAHEFVVASSLIIVTPDPGIIDVRYLNHVLKSTPAQEAARSYSRGAGLPRLSIWNFSRGVPIPVPPLEEQRRIAAHLDDVTSKIDAMLAKVAELKDLLTERRAALITDVVTGRKDVA